MTENARRLGWAVILATVIKSAAVHGQALPDSGNYDRQGVEAASAVFRAYPLTGTWPGYAGPAEFVLCGRSAGTIIMARGPVSSSLQRVDSLQEGAPIYVVHGRLPRLEDWCFVPDYAWEGRTLLAFPVVDSVFGIKDPVLATLVGLYHEEFHRYQVRHFAATTGTTLAILDEEPQPEEALSTVEFQQDASRERTLLAAALQAQPLDSVRALARNYLAARRMRMARLQRMYVIAENHHERKEGSAQLVGYEAALHAVGRPSEDRVPLIVWDLRHAPPFDADPNKSSYRHWHIYASGSAIGVLLDRLSPGWRSAMQAGETFPALLEQALRR